MLEEKIQAIASAGFQSIELFENDVLTFPGSITELRDIIHSHGLTIVTYQPFRDFEGLPEPLRSKAMERARHKLDLTAELGCDLMMVCSSVAPQAQGGISRAVDDLAELGELAAQRGLRVAYEALAWGRFINDYRDSWEIVRRVGHDNVGLCLDTFHIFSRDTEIDMIRSIPGDRIFLVQVADAPRMTLDSLSWSRHYRCFPGQGELALGKFMDALSATGYRGPLSLEVFNDQFRAGDTQQTARDGYRSLVFLADRTETDDSSPLVPAQSPTGVAFIEFAIEPSARSGFCSLLSALGFTKTGLHKSKNVEHWQQSNVHFVLNFEDGSYAQDYLSKHGSSVCAIALQVDAVEPVVERARQLNYPAFYGDPMQDTHGNPAIAGLSEGLLYFVADRSPSIWQRDFQPANVSSEEPLIHRIDHVSLSMSYEEMLRSILLYRSMFSMTPTSTVDVYDPGGLVRSQVMRTQDSSVCFALNSSEATSTLSRKIIRRQSGAGVQHIALECSSIKIVAEKLAESNVGVLKLPDNFYDDLQARFGLARQELDDMKRLGLLYDEDDDGCFYQLYTDHFCDSFCFELVQRDGYKGFGAQNAPIRSAMQLRALSSGQ